MAPDVGHQRRRPEPLHPVGRQVDAQGEDFFIARPLFSSAWGNYGNELTTLPLS